MKSKLMFFVLEKDGEGHKRPVDLRSPTLIRLARASCFASTVVFFALPQRRRVEGLHPQRWWPSMNSNALRFLYETRFPALVVVPPRHHQVHAFRRFRFAVVLPLPHQVQVLVIGKSVIKFFTDQSIQLGVNQLCFLQTMKLMMNI